MGQPTFRFLAFFSVSHTGFWKLPMERPVVVVVPLVRDKDL